MWTINTVLTESTDDFFSSLLLLLRFHFHTKRKRHSMDRLFEITPAIFSFELWNFFFHFLRGRRVIAFYLVFENDTWITTSSLLNIVFFLSKWFSVYGKWRAKLSVRERGIAARVLTSLGTYGESMAFDSLRLFSETYFLSFASSFSLWCHIMKYVYIFAFRFFLPTRDDVDKFVTMNNDKHMLPEP